MGMLELLARLNRRHKVVLFVTLLAAGFILITGGGIGPGLGSILLGIAFALAVGSNSRAIHGLFVTTGLVLLLAPSLYFWAAARRQEKALARMERNFPSAASVGDDARVQVQLRDGRIGTVPKKDLPEALKMGANVHSPAGVGSSGDGPEYLEEYTSPKTGARYGLTEKGWVQLSPPTEFQVVSIKPRPFVLHDVIVENRGTEAAGLVLFAIGMGLLIVVKPASVQR